MSEWVEEMRIRDLASRIRPEPDCVTWSNAVLLDALCDIDRLRDTLREQMEYTVELMTALRHAMSEPSVHDHGNCELCDAQEREITALRAQLAAVERERDEWRHSERIATVYLNGERQRVAALSEALEYYAGGFGVSIEAALSHVAERKARAVLRATPWA